MRKEKKPTDLAKAYLRKIEKLHAVISSKSDDLLMLRELAEKITAGMDPTASFGSPGQDKLGDAMAKIVDLDAEIKQNTVELDALVKEVWELLGEMEDPKHIKVLSKLYIQLKGWVTIGEELGCSTRTVQNIHGKALLCFAELMKKHKVGAWSE